MSPKLKNIGLKNKSLLQYYSFTRAEQRKYPIITGILKELTPERIKKEIEEVKKVELPPELQKWVEEYEKVGKRNRVFWKWIYAAIQKTTLSAIEKKYKEYAWNTEFMLVMLSR